jgi:signal transduction histidine kinase
VDGTLGERLRRVDPRIWDGLLAAALLAIGILAFVVRDRLPDEPPDAVGYALVVGSAMPIAWRRRAPSVVFAIVAASAGVASLFGYWPEVAFPVLVATYSAAAYRARADVVRLALPVAAAASVAIAVGERSHRRLNGISIVLDLVVTFATPALLGRLTYNRRRRAAIERDRAAADAVAAERARIARELHDVVAHHMSVMVVQAGAARAVGANDPDAASEALRQIEASGRTGLLEMRRLLELLKADDGRAALEPQPGLAGLDPLLDGMRAAGLPVEATIEGEPRSLPPGVDLSAYRIVQEALTNTLRHAGASRAGVRLRYAADAIEIEVVDDGRGADPSADTGAGHGLIGMRERVQLFGGDLETGSAPDGGFHVRARLPAAAEAAP